MIGLSQEAKLFIVEFPVLAPTCQVLNSIAIFHEVGGLMRETLSVNAHKYVQTTSPRFDRGYSLLLAQCREREVDHSLHSARLTVTGLPRLGWREDTQSQ